MKKINSFMVAAVAIIAAVSCNKEFTDGQENIPAKGEPVVYTASAAVTKAVLNEAGTRSEWDGDDAITVHDGEKGWTFTTEGSGEKAEFTNSEGFGDYRSVMAVYPAGEWTADPAAKSVTAAIPASQQAVAGTYDQAAALAVAYSETAAFAFMNAHALVKFSVNIDNVTHVIFQGNTSEPVAGNVEVILGNEGVEVECLEPTVTSVECHAGEDAYFEKDKTYYMAVAPQDFNSGITLKVRIDGGEAVAVKATDNKVAAAPSTIVNLNDLSSSAPTIERVGVSPLCGVAGGTVPFEFTIATNSIPLSNIVISCEALSLNEVIVPEGNSKSYDLKKEIAVASGVSLRNAAYKVVVTNTMGQSAEYEGTLNIIDRVYAIGTGTMAKEKVGQALPMTQSQTNPNEFEFITWINVVGEGVKFLSAPSWEDFNWGLNENGSIVSPQSDFIRTESTGYHKFTFNAATWKYKVEKVEAPATPATSELWLNGWLYEWDGQQWCERGWWDRQFKVHPDNPHCFYFDMKTGPEGSNVAVWKIRERLDGGRYYGFNSSEEPGGNWNYYWWEKAAPYYIYDSGDKVPSFREDGRKNAVMRLMVDTFTGHMSWMPLKEQVDAGWTIYPPMYTPAE